LGKLSDHAPISGAHFLVSQPVVVEFPMSSSKKTTLCILSITFLWGVSICVTDPVGEFPLNDDWSYTRTAIKLFETGSIQIDDWAAQSLISHVAYGALAIKIFGFSFTVLRCSILLLAVIGNIAFFLLLRELNVCRTKSLLVTLLMAFNPISYCLSFSFMTDITFLTFTFMSFLFYIKGIKKSSVFYTLLGSTLAALAILSRQWGVVITASFVFYHLINLGTCKNRNDKPWVLIFSGLTIPLLAFFLFYYWQTQISGPTSAYTSTLQRLGQWEWVQAKDNLFAVIAYVSFFSIPWTLTVLLFDWKTIRKELSRNIWLHGLLPCFVLFHIFRFANKFDPVAWAEQPLKPSMPYLSNYMFNFGLGPVTLADIYHQKASFPHELSSPIISLASLLIFLSSLVLVYYLAAIGRSLRENRRDPSSFLSIFCILYLFILLTIHTPYNQLGLYDRYLLPLVGTFFLVVFSLFREKLSIPLFLFFASFFIFFAVAGTSDYLNWNRARWAGINYLLDEKNVATYRIDGGVEYNGLYTYDLVTKRKVPVKGMWWWVVDNKYQVTYNAPKRNYMPIKTIPYFSWLHFEERNIYINERIRRRRRSDNG
jgi:hypothetical protein